LARVFLLRRCLSYNSIRNSGYTDLLIISVITGYFFSTFFSSGLPLISRNVLTLLYPYVIISKISPSSFMYKSLSSIIKFVDILGVGTYINKSCFASANRCTIQPFIYYSTAEEVEERFTGLQPFHYLISSLVFFLYWTYFESTTGQSIGKGVMNLKTTNLNGAVAERKGIALAAFGKAFLLPFDVVLGWIFTNDRRQRIFN